MPVKMQPVSVIKANLGIEPNGPVHAYFTKTCKDHMEKYVPYREGNLRGTARVTTNQIIYNQLYAHYMYYGKLYVDPDTGSSWAKKDATKVPTNIDLVYHTPGTGPYWDKRMWSAEKQDVIREVQDFMNRR